MDNRERLASMHWDVDLNEVRIEDDKVLGVKCGLLAVEDQYALKQGDVYFRLISATFIDEVAARGRHTVSVDVLDEAGYRLHGKTVVHGWPWSMWPAMDPEAPVTAAVSGSELAEWGLYGTYDPNFVECGPYWVQCVGKSDVFYGMGLPWNRHVSFVAVYQRMIWGGGPPEPEPGSDFEEEVLEWLETLEGELADLSRHLGAVK